SLAETNHLSVLAARPEKCFALIGAAFVMEIEWKAFTWAVTQACRYLDVLPAASDAELERTICEVMQRFQRGVQAIGSSYGALALEELLQGVIAAARLAQLARDDLEQQLRWMASLDDYVAMAHSVGERIATQRPDIDRQTFVE